MIASCRPNRPRRSRCAPPGAAAERAGTRTDCLAVALAAAVLGLALRPFPNTPFGDDWTYAWSVEQWLLTGEVRFLAWSSQLNVVQVLWGVLFCLPFGFSFTALRLSTWTLAVGCLCALYLLLRELGVGRREALLGTAAFGLNPLFFIFATTFMTDVPFLALMAGGSYAMVRAVRETHDGWLLAASGLAAAAIGVRLTGAASPVAMAVALVLHGGRWGRHPTRILVALAPLAFLVALLWWGAGQLQRSADLSYLGEAVLREKFSNVLAYGLPGLPRWLLQGFFFSANTLGIALLPLALATRIRGLVTLAALFLALCGTLLLAGHRLGVPTPVALAPGSGWSLAGLGGAERLVPDHRPTDLPEWWTWASTFLWAGSVSLACATVSRYGIPRAASFVAWLFAAQFGLIAALWLFHDRYVLVLMPSAIALHLAGKPPFRPRVAAAAVALFALLSIGGTMDHLGYDRALWRGVEELRSRGAADREIDGGYVVNGWLHYAHPDNAPRHEAGEIFVPGVTTTATLRYRISNAAPPGWMVLNAFPYRRWLGRSGVIYVLEQSPPARQPSPSSP